MPDKMKAVVKIKPELGAVLQETKIPQPKDDEVLIKIKATSICGTDVHIYRWDSWSDNRIGAKALPQVMGHETAGEIVELGKAVKGLKIGDYVSLETHIPDPADLQTKLGQMHIGEHMQIVGVDRDGTFAEYIAAPASVCWTNDKSIPPEIACVQEPLGNATYAVLGEDNDIAGKSMVIIGDGPIALFAVGVARACGVTKIIIDGQSDFNLEIAKKMGADHVLRNTDDNHSQRVDFVKDHTNGFGADIVLDMAGAPSGLDEGFQMLRKGGRFSAFGVLSGADYKIDYNNYLVFKGAQVHGINGRKMYDTWYRVGNLLSSGRLDIRPVITHTMMLEDFAEAFDKLMALPRCASKIVLFIDKGEFEKAKARIK
jgi:threonine 3-dehydrogenase